jgi:hypothetical protein
MIARRPPLRLRASSQTPLTFAFWRLGVRFPSYSAPWREILRSALARCPPLAIQEALNRLRQLFANSLYLGNLLH